MALGMPFLLAHIDIRSPCHNSTPQGCERLPFPSPVNAVLSFEVRVALFLFYFSLNYGKAYEQPLWSFYLRILIYTREQKNGDQKLKCRIRCRHT